MRGHRSCGRADNAMRTRRGCVLWACDLCRHGARQRVSCGLTGKSTLAHVARRPCTLTATAVRSPTAFAFAAAVGMGVQMERPRRIGIERVA